jgi:hypothetical protein
MYKFVAIDLDGTLLNSYGVVTKNTKEVLKKAIEKGVEIVIASGRLETSIKAIANEIESKNYFIAGNGSTIYDIKNNEKIYEKYIPKNKALEVIKICEENSISYNIYTEEEIIAKNLEYNVLYYYKENQKKEPEKQTKIKIISNIYEYLMQVEDKKILKITICDKDKMVFNSIIRKLKLIKNLSVLDVSHMSRKIIKQGTEEVAIEYYYTEITSDGVDKWNAIKFLIDKLGITESEVIAIGDNINDKKMIENAGMGVAMGGSTPKITQIANLVTDNNNEDGVAKALEKILDI